MRTIREINNILSACKHVDSHVHTHLCDGGADMTVENIAENAKKRGIDGVILTPHFHKKVSDGETSLYFDSDESIFLKLRDEIEYYERKDGSVKFILSTEADIISADGEICLKASPQTESALDMVSPTFNYHPCLPLVFVGLTMGAKIDDLHDSGAYAAAAEKIGGVSEVLSLMYETEINAVNRCPYPMMLGHLFMVHSVHPYRNNCFGAKREHLSLMKDGVSRLISACKDADAIVDMTGVHLQADQTASDKMKSNDFLVDFQRFAFDECRRLGVPAYFGSDAHGLGDIGGEAEYYRSLLSVRD